MLSTTWEVAVNCPCLLGEGPVWDAARQRLIWVDILAGAVHQYDPQAKTHTTLTVPHLVGAVAVRADGGLVAALQNGFAWLNPLSGAVNFIADPESHRPDNRFNDGKCDPAGRFWAGTMALAQTPGAGGLYALETDGSVTVKLTNISISNGLAWSLDHRFFYYIDTPTYQVMAYRFDVAGGHISEARVAITIPVADGYPDGMTIDREGMLWIAHWGGCQVTRWNPQTGILLHRIALPVAQVTSCTFGGGDLGDLYITSARTGLTNDELASQPLAGSVFCIKAVGVSGLPAHTYASGPSVV